MDNPIQQQSLAALKQFAEQACKAQLAALQSTAEIQRLYLQAMESQAKASHDFATSALDARDFNHLASVWPGLLTFLQESVESAYRTNKQVWEVVQTATRELAEAASSNAQAVGDAAREALGAATGKKPRA